MINTDGINQDGINQAGINQAGINENMINTAGRAPYGERLTEVVGRRGPLCVGLDPHPGLLDQWGLPRTAAGLERCARGLVEALGETVAVFKPQSAFYEAYGSAGIAVLESVLSDCAEAGAISLLDVKRGDIGSTMDAYASAYLSDGSSLAADAITVSPYLGFGSLQGAIDLAERNGRGVYVLARTSNPEAVPLQEAIVEDASTVAQMIVDAAAAANAATGLPVGHVGLVVGATIGANAYDFDRVGGSILAPGVGAQGGTADGLRSVFGAAMPRVLPSMSREIIGAGPDPAALRTAAETFLGRMASVLAVG